MKLCTSWIAGALLVLAVGVTSTQAADLYWDINGANAGATDDGSGVAGGASTGAFWSTDPTGASATAAWVAGSRAVFSAGNNATASSTSNGSWSVVSGTNGTSAYGGMLIEEGEIEFLNTMSQIAGSTVEVMAGTAIRQNGVNVSAGTGRFTIQLDGPTAVARHTNPGGAGSFISSTGDFFLNGGGTFDYTQANHLIIINTASSISGTGPLIKEGPGIIGFANITATYTGATIINNGEIRIRTNNNTLPLATDVTVNNPGVLNLNGLTQQIGSLTGAGNVGLGGSASATSAALPDGGGLIIDGATSTAFDGALKNVANADLPGAQFPGVGSGNGRLVKRGAGTITFNGQNDLSGSVRLNGGGIVVSNTGSLCGPIADIVMISGTLTLNNATQSVENFGGALTSAGVATTNQSANTSTILNGTQLIVDPSAGAAFEATNYLGAISGTGSLRKQNTIAGGVATTLSLGGNNTYQGGTQVAGGRLHANSNTALGTGAATVSSTGVLAGTGSIANNIVVQSNGHAGGGLGAGAGGILTTSGDVSVQANGNIDAVLGAAGGSLTGDYNSNGVVDGADYVVWRNGGAPDSTVAGYNTWRSNFGATGGGGLGTSDYLKSTKNNGATFAAGSILTLLSGSVTPGGTYVAFEYAGNHTGVLGTDIIVNNATGYDLVSAVDNPTLKRFEVTISSTPQSARSWVDTVINGNWSATAPANWTPSGQPNGPGVTGNFAGTNAHIVTISDSDKTLGTMNLSGTGGYTIAATGTNSLIMNTITGTPAINVTAGTHTISAPMTLSKATTVTSSAGTALNLTGEVTNAAGLTKASAGAMSISGVLRGGGTLGVTGGSLTLSGVNTYSGATTISAGATVNANNVGTTSATGTSAVSNSGILNVNGRITGGITTPAGGVTNVAGTVTGAQTVSGGTLDLGTLGVTTGTVTTSVNGVLQNAPTFASGVQTNSITLGATGRLAVGGVGGTGALTMSTAGLLSLGATSIWEVDVTPGGFDQLIMQNTTAGTGGLTITAGAAVRVNLSGYDFGSNINAADGSYPIGAIAVTGNAATQTAVAALATATGSTAGHSYSFVLTGSTIFLNVATPGVGAGAAVPEPTTFGLLAIALTAMAAGRRNRKS